MKNLVMIDSLLNKTSHLATEVADKVKWSLVATPFVVIIERYIFNDWNFLKFLAVFIALDTLLGFGHAVYRGQINVGKLMGILVKGIIYGPILVLGHVFENFEVSGHPMEGGFYLKVLFYTGLLIVEAISIIRNLGRIDKRLVPKFILKRFEGFNETGDFNELTRGHTRSTNTDFQSPYGDDLSPYPPNHDDHEQSSH